MLTAVALLAAVGVLQVGCRLEPDPGATEGSNGSTPGRRIVPRAGEGMILSDTDYEPETDDDDIQPTSSVAIQLPADYLVIDVKDHNIDMDEMDEQIVVFKIQGDETDRIHVLVLDYDFVRGGYAVSWQSPTSSTNSRSVKISAADMTGNGLSEIILFGIDNQGRQTLDVFTAVSDFTGQGLQFEQIFQTAVDGTIDLEDPGRGEEFIAGSDSSEPHRIIVQRQDEQSSNIMDLIFEEHHWNAGTTSYELVEQRRIPGVEMEETQLQQLYSSGATTFENFLEGPWYRTRGGSPGDPDMVLVSFFPRRREIVFLENDMQQVFNWDVSSRTIYRNIRMDVRNQILPSISTFGSVAVTGLETIRLQLQGHNDWDGEYRRLSPSLQNAILEDPNAVGIVRSSEYAGLFQNATGTELLFNGPRFSFRHDGNEYSGGYSLFSFNGRTILELQNVSSFGLPRERFSYSVELTTEESGERIIRRLTMQPVTLRGRDVTPESGETIHLEQIIEQSDEG